MMTYICKYIYFYGSVINIIRLCDKIIRILLEYYYNARMNEVTNVTYVGIV